MSDIDLLKERLARACRVLGRLELTKAATGHVSARLHGADLLLVRARGPEELGVRYTTADQIVTVDFDGRLAGNHAPGLKPPLEIFIHTELYRRQPDIQAVVHMHPPLVVAFTACDEPLLPIYGAYDPRSAQLAIGGLPTYPRSILIDTPELGEEFARTMKASPACLMRGHGVTTAAGNIEDAALNMILVNELANMTYLARTIGTPAPIPDEEQSSIMALEPRTDAAKDLSPRSAALWRYYCTLTDSG